MAALPYSPLQSSRHTTRRPALSSCVCVCAPVCLFYLNSIVCPITTLIKVNTPADVCLLQCEDVSGVLWYPEGGFLPAFHHRTCRWLCVRLGLLPIRCREIKGAQTEWCGLLNELWWSVHLLCQVMNQPTGPDGKGTMFTGMIDCFRCDSMTVSRLVHRSCMLTIVCFLCRKSIVSEGPLSLWKG